MKNQTEFSKEVIFSELYGAEIKIKNKWCFIIIPKWFCKEDVVRIKYSPHSKCIIEMSYWDGAEWTNIKKYTTFPGNNMATKNRVACIREIIEITERPGNIFTKQICLDSGEPKWIWIINEPGTS